MSNEQYDKIVNELIIIKRKLENYCRTNPKSQINDIYRGVCILFTPLLLNPKIMLIGINSGAGYYYKTGKIRSWFKPLSYHEYIKENYSLAKQTKNIFREINRFELLAESVKTNFNYFITDNTTNLKRLMRLVNYELNIDLRNKSEEWTNTMIKLVKPKIIVAEGFTVFNSLMRSSCNNIIVKESMNKEGNVKLGYYNDIKVFAYKRNHSSIIDSESVKRELKKVLRRLNI